MPNVTIDRSVAAPRPRAVTWVAQVFMASLATAWVAAFVGGARRLRRTRPADAPRPPAFT